MEMRDRRFHWGLAEGGGKPLEERAERPLWARVARDKLARS